MRSISCRRWARLSRASNGQRLDERVAHGHPRIERGVRVLEHHLHPPPALPSLPSGAGDVVAIERDRPVRQGLQSDDRLGQRGLARTRFADETDHGAVGKLEADVVDGGDARLPSP